MDQMTQLSQIELKMMEFTVDVETFGEFPLIAKEGLVFFEHPVIQNGAQVKDGVSEIGVTLKAAGEAIGSYQATVYETDIPRLLDISSDLFFSEIASESVQIKVSSLIPGSSLKLWLEPLGSDFQLERPYSQLILLNASNDDQL